MERDLAPQRPYPGDYDGEGSTDMTVGFRSMVLGTVGSVPRTLLKLRLVGPQATLPLQAAPAET